MRTTLDIDDTLLSLARERARARKMTLTAFVEAALAAATAPVDESPAPFRLNLPIERGTYIGGVDLADRDALYDRMEGRR
ncbi:MAG: hypothetical protein KC635_12820 [Myxococcales bacterium]|nr:hypothetical protein [Myxococcales bacterium]MCB9734387.1 DUF2191 domain-containing protein [Deltaproteobacteria bacterium]